MTKQNIFIACENRWNFLLASIIDALIVEGQMDISVNSIFVVYVFVKKQMLESSWEYVSQAGKNQSSSI